jgi:rhodanese-related sulfurtransferase
MILKELLQKQMRNEIVIVDVRNEDEYKTNNPLPSVNIPLASLGANPEQIVGFDKPVVLVCLSGRRSEIAQEAIHNSTDIKVEVLEDGLQALIQ